MSQNIVQNGMRKIAQNSANKKPMNALRRLKQDYLMMMKDPVPYIMVAPLPSNILEWHYVIHGPENSPYEGGIYHGKLKFPPDYPFRPPSFYMITPNGRFEVNVKICLSISDFHPNTWNPTWNLSTILIGLLSFMMENRPTYGSIMSSDGYKRKLAKQSLEANLNNTTFVELFPDVVTEIKEELENRKKKLTLSQSNGSSKSGSSNNDNNSTSGLNNTDDAASSSSSLLGRTLSSSLSANNHSTMGEEGANSSTNTANLTTNNIFSTTSSRAATLINQATGRTAAVSSKHPTSTSFWSMVYNLVAVFLLIGLGCAVRFFLS